MVIALAWMAGAIMNERKKKEHDNTAAECCDKAKFMFTGKHIFLKIYHVGIKKGYLLHTNNYTPAITICQKRPV